MAQAQVQFQSAFTPPIFRYIRNTFIGTGLDNFTPAPAQNPDMFEILTNVMPISSGNLQRRWGYQVWNNTNPLVAQRLYEFQNNISDMRLILAAAGDGTGAASDTNNILAYDESGTFDITVLTPSTGASIPYICVSRNYAYISDGVALDLQKWDGTTLSNWGIAAPTTSPTLSPQSGVSQNWAANTEFWTMGVFGDGNGNSQQLISVNALNNNSTQFGLSGPGQPAWNQTKGGTTADGTVTWTNVGQITLWQPGMTVTYRQPVYDPSTGGLMVNFTNATVTTGTVKPTFSGVDGTFTNETTATGASQNFQWGCVFNINAQPTSKLLGLTLTGPKNNDGNIWFPDTNYSQFDHFQAGVVEPTALPSTINQNLSITPIYLQLNLGAAGKSGTGSGTPPATLATSPGGTSNDNQLTWLCLGSDSWTALHASGNPPIPWINSQLGQIFTCLKDSNSNLQVCTTSTGVVGATQPVWATSFGATTADGSNVVWTCVGPAPSWSANTQFFLPLAGWVAPVFASQFGGTEITPTVGGNPFEEFATASGKSGATAPSFPTITGNTVTDGGVTWTCGGPFSAVAGDITLVDGVYYFVVYWNPNTGNYSDLSPVSAFSGPLTNESIVLNNIPVSPDPQVTSKVILRTADGGDQTTLYFVTSIPNNVTSTTDNVSAINLLNNNIYQQTDQFGNLIGVANNQPPLAGSFTISNQGRLFMIDGQTLLFSKNLFDLTTSTGLITGRWEEDWPPQYQLDISSIVETPRGLQTDGYALYIGTERKIHKLLGNGPTNFSQPQVVFNEVGILNQTTWQQVFAEGQPVGSMWLTPDNRVVGSDYNVFYDAGHLIQATLNTINSSVAQKVAWAMFVSNGPFDLYILALPTGSSTTPNTLCVFDLRAKQWTIWQMADNLSAGVFNIDASGIPQWIFSAESGIIYKTSPGIYQDRFGSTTPTDYPVTIRTSWLSIYEDSFRKLLNEMEVMTGDSNLLVTVEGAATASDFSNPVTLVSNVPMTLGIFGEFKVMLAASPSKSRWYRLTFTSNNTIQNVLQGYNIEAIPLNQV